MCPFEATYAYMVLPAQTGLEVAHWSRPSSWVRIASHEEGRKNSCSVDLSASSWPGAVFSCLRRAPTRRPPPPRTCRSFSEKYYAGLALPAEEPEGLTAVRVEQLAHPERDGQRVMLMFGRDTVYVCSRPISGQVKGATKCPYPSAVPPDRRRRHPADCLCPRQPRRASRWQGRYGKSG